MRASLCATALAVSFLIASGHAQAGPRELAKAQFGEGQRAFEREDYTEALRHFRRAFELHEHDAVRFNIGVCLERLSRFREALAQYEAAASSKTLDKKQQKRATTKADAVRAELATLKVTGSPEGAEVSVDGEVFCTVPCSAPIDPRKQEVVVRAGELSEVHEVHPRRQEQTVLHVTLVAKSSEPVAAPKRRDVRKDDSPAAATRGPGFLTWGGLGLVAVGGVGIAVFGPKAKSEHDDFVATGSEDARSAGSTARDLTNVAIGVAVVGAAITAYDLLVLAKKPEQSAKARFAAPGFRF